MKKRILAISLFICIIINIFSLASCDGTPGSSSFDDKPVDAVGPTDSDADTLELPYPPEKTRAIIHMIRPVDTLEEWQSGKTEPSASLYVDDMMMVLDELEWKSGDDEVLISGDFDFRINLYRDASELRDFEKFVTDDNANIFPEDNEEEANISVQYLINHTDKTVNMRFFDYSAHVFDVYAEMNDNQMRIITLCLKYYFGPSN